MSLHVVAVTGLITDSKGRILMVLSPRRGWEIPGGQVEEGEDLIQALQREFLEETGVEVRATTLAGIFSNLTPPTKVIFGFLGEWVSGTLQISDESLETEWVDKDLVLGRITHPAIHDRAKDMLAFAGQVIYKTYTMSPYQVHETRFLTP